MKRLLSSKWDLPELPLAGEWPGTTEDAHFSAESVPGTFQLSVSPSAERVSLQSLERFVKSPALAGCEKKVCTFDDRLAAIATKRAGNETLTLLIFSVSRDEEALVTYVTSPLLGAVERRLGELQKPLPGIAAATMSDGNLMLGTIALPTPIAFLLGTTERAPLFEEAAGLKELTLGGAVVLATPDDIAVVVASLHEFKTTPVRELIERRADALWESKLSSEILPAGRHGFLTSDVVWCARWESEQRLHLEYLVQDEARQTWSVTYSVIPSQRALLDELEAKNATLKPPRPSEVSVVSSKTLVTGSRD